MALAIEFDTLTVEGYRTAVNDVIALHPHSKAIAELKERHPSIRPVQIVTAYLLSQGEDLRKACIYAGTSPFLFQQTWLAVPDFKLLMTEVAPEHTQEAEGFTLRSKDQHHIIWAEMTKRALHDIEAAKHEAGSDRLLESGLLLSVEKTVGRTTTKSYYLNPAYKALERAMQAAGELESLYSPRADEVTEDTMTKGVSKMIIGRVAPAADQAARDAAIKNN